MSYFLNVLHIDGLLGLGHMPDNADIKREDDLRLWRNHAVLHLRVGVDVEESGGQFGYAVPLAVHEETAEFSMKQSTQPLQDLEDHLFHVDVLLHVLDQIIKYGSFFDLADLLEGVHVHSGLGRAQHRGYGSWLELLLKIVLNKVWTDIQELLYVFAPDTHLWFHLLH